MRITMVHPAADPCGRAYFPGRHYPVADEEAARLIAGGLARPFDPPGAARAGLVEVELVIETPAGDVRLVALADGPDVAAAVPRRLAPVQSSARPGGGGLAAALDLLRRAGAGVALTAATDPAFRAVLEAARPRIPIRAASRRAAWLAGHDPADLAD